MASPDDGVAGASSSRVGIQASRQPTTRTALALEAASGGVSPRTAPTYATTPRVTSSQTSPRDRGGQVGADAIDWSSPTVVTSARLSGDRGVLGGPARITAGRLAVDAGPSASARQVP